MATRVDSESTILATERKVRELQEVTPDLLPALGVWLRQLIDYGASLAPTVSDKLVTKTMANNYGFCVNSSGDTYNLSGILYKDDLLVQLRDLISSIIVNTAGETFNKEIHFLNCLDGSGASAGLFGTRISSIASEISTIEYFITTSGNISFNHNYLYRTDKKFIIGYVIGVGLYQLIYNDELHSNDRILFPVYINNTETLTVLLWVGTNSINYVTSGGLGPVYIHIRVYTPSTTTYVFNIPFASLGRTSWNRLTNFKPSTWTYTNYQYVKN